MKKHKNLIISSLLVCCSLAMIYVGVMRDEHLSVLQKAGQICLECIGIG
ncbi:MAG: hypothetical protein HXL95_00900 [[Eubacterium] sulci]|nr:hypothetical protein [[Eubacterium] sulci]